VAAAIRCSSSPIAPGPGRFAVLFGIIQRRLRDHPLMAADLFGTLTSVGSWDHHHGRRGGGSDRADAGRGDSRLQRQLRAGVFRPPAGGGSSRRRRTPPGRPAPQLIYHRVVPSAAHRKLGPDALGSLTDD
jgi:hypothetical protein